MRSEIWRGYAREIAGGKPLIRKLRLGRTLYIQSVDLARSHNDNTKRCMALLHLALEEARVDTNRAKMILGEAESEIGGLSITDSNIARRLVNSIEANIEK